VLSFLVKSCESWRAVERALIARASLTQRQ